MVELENFQIINFDKYLPIQATYFEVHGSGVTVPGVDVNESH